MEEKGRKCLCMFGSFDGTAIDVARWGLCKCFWSLHVYTDFGSDLEVPYIYQLQSLCSVDLVISYNHHSSWFSPLPHFLSVYKYPCFRYDGVMTCCTITLPLNCHSPISNLQSFVCGSEIADIISITIPMPVFHVHISFPPLFQYDQTSFSSAPSSHPIILLFLPLILTSSNLLNTTFAPEKLFP